MLQKGNWATSHLSFKLKILDDMNQSFLINGYNAGIEVWKALDPAHVNIESLKHTWVTFLRGNKTALFQQMDHSIIFTLKAYNPKEFVTEM